MFNIYKNILPKVSKELAYWENRAKQIPNEELRTQALASISSKDFHCEGGSIMALLGRDHLDDCIKFIVAYQTISDYLDNLCDRSTSQDPEDFTALHDSMLHCFKLDVELENYYRFREDQDDAGYLADLVKTCREVLSKSYHFKKIQGHLLTLAQVYCELQIHKHVKLSERIPRLTTWFDEYKESLPPMTWYEFSACAGSTLGVFCLVSYSFQKELSHEKIVKAYEGYFPYIQGVHILMDYLIDQEEDVSGGDLNFCSYYASQDELKLRFMHFIDKAIESSNAMPDAKFHRLIVSGLVGIYLADDKVTKGSTFNMHTKELLATAGFSSKFFNTNCRAYYKIKSMRK